MAVAHYEQLSMHTAGYSSDSSVSVMSRGRGRFVKMLGSPGQWMGLCHTSNESLVSVCTNCHNQKGFSRTAITSERGMPYIQQVTRRLLVTEVISGTGFFAMTEVCKEKAAELRDELAAKMKESYMAAERVVPRMVCAVMIDGTWERVIVKRLCSAQSCLLRVAGDKPEDPQQDYWHVSMMEVGTIKCVPVCRVALVTKQLATVRPKARLYFLRRVHLKDDKEVCCEAKEWLKSKLLNNQFLAASVYYHPCGKGKNQAEIFVDAVNLSDALVEAGYAEYNHNPDQRGKPSVSAASSLQDLARASSRDSLTSRTSSQCLKTGSVYSTLPDLMKLIDHLMKKRNENANLISRNAILNLAIRAQKQNQARHHQRLCEHGQAALHKQKNLLRRLRDEYPFIHEIRELKDSMYDYLVEILEDWKIKYKAAQRKSNDATKAITDIFMSFTNKTSGKTRYLDKCKMLDAALSNELLLQNEGQDLAHMLVPVVAAKIVNCISQLEDLGSGDITVKEKAQTMHQFITSAKFITSLTLEALAKDILKGLYHYHERGVAYKHLHPDNVLIMNGHAALRPIQEQKECQIRADWPFEGVEVANEDLGKPIDVYNFGLLVLWMACKGAVNYRAATLKFYCNVALIKMTMAEDPNIRPLVDSMVCCNNYIFPLNSQWCAIPLRDYLNEVFNGKADGEVNEASELPSDIETAEGDSTSETESIFQQQTDESGNETRE